MIFKEYPDREALAMKLADTLASDLVATLARHERVSIAVPGGTSPGPVFDVLSGLSNVEWARVDVMLTDERWVPEGHARSNTALLRSRLLAEQAGAARLVPLFRDGPAEEGVKILSQGIEPLLPLSVVLLGMGTDMHTASLFPGAPGLKEALSPDAPVLNVVRPAGEPDLRVSLSARVLNGALSKHLLVTGPEKRAALERAQELSAEDAPISAVLTGMTVHWAE